MLVVGTPGKKLKTDGPVITFIEAEATELHQPYDDPLVISSVISNFKTWRVLTDSGGSDDILF